MRLGGIIPLLVIGATALIALELRNLKIDPDKIYDAGEEEL